MRARFGKLSASLRTKLTQRVLEPRIVMSLRTQHKSTFIEQYQGKNSIEVLDDHHLIKTRETLGGLDAQIESARVTVKGGQEVDKTRSLNA